MINIQRYLDLKISSLYHQLDIRMMEHFIKFRSAIYNNVALVFKLNRSKHKKKYF